jgi:hypothetical protein
LDTQEQEVVHAKQDIAGSIARVSALLLQISQFALPIFGRGIALYLTTKALHLRLTGFGVYPQTVESFTALVDILALKQQQVASAIANSRNNSIIVLFQVTEQELNLQKLSDIAQAHWEDYKQRSGTGIPASKKGRTTKQAKPASRLSWKQAKQKQTETSMRKLVTRLQTLLTV